jgi:hypothetical protein
VAYAKRQLRRQDVGNRGNQEDYDEERADNKIGTKVARVNNRIDARSKNDAKIDAKAAAGSKTSKSKKKVNCKKLFLAVLCANCCFFLMHLAARNTNWPQFILSCTF